MRTRLPLATALAVLAATVLGVAATLGSSPGPSYGGVNAFSATAENGNLAKLTVTVDGTIPRQPDEFIGAHAVVGLAWADLDTGNVFVATIHPVLGRDSHQNPDAWHAHTATLGGGATGPNDFCVLSINSAPTAGIAIHGNTMQVNVLLADLPVAPSAIDGAVGFTIEGDSSCASGLAVRVID
ncbi:MAG: hypothetical protein L0221_03855 [Chloroflexi bacterium]|nr:hypothetical protein [Chloroflexota bacterium]